MSQGVVGFEDSSGGVAYARPQMVVWGVQLHFIYGENWISGPTRVCKCLDVEGFTKLLNIPLCDFTTII